MDSDDQSCKNEILERCELIKDMSLSKLDTISSSDITSSKLKLDNPAKIELKQLLKYPELTIVENLVLLVNDEADAEAIGKLQFLKRAVFQFSDQKQLWSKFFSVLFQSRKSNELVVSWKAFVFLFVDSEDQFESLIVTGSDDQGKQYAIIPALSTSDNGGDHFVLVTISQQISQTDNEQPRLYLLRFGMKHKTNALMRKTLEETSSSIVTPQLVDKAVNRIDRIFSLPARNNQTLGDIKNDIEDMEIEEEKEEKVDEIEEEIEEEKVDEIEEEKVDEIEEEIEEEKEEKEDMEEKDEISDRVIYEVDAENLEYINQKELQLLTDSDLGLIKPSDPISDSNIKLKDAIPITLLGLTNKENLIRLLTIRNIILGRKLIDPSGQDGIINMSVITDIGKDIGKDIVDQLFEKDFTSRSSENSGSHLIQNSMDLAIKMFTKTGQMSQMKVVELSYLDVIYMPKLIDISVDLMKDPLLLVKESHIIETAYTLYEKVCQFQGEYFNHDPENPIKMKSLLKFPDSFIRQPTARRRQPTTHRRQPIKGEKDDPLDCILQ